MSLFDRFSLGEGFKRYFEISAAFDSGRRDEVYGIRHEVYCEELGFEPVRPDRRETDEYDAHSLHCLMRTSTPPNALVGCNRLVLARPEDPDYPLPFERTCAATLDRSIIDPAKEDRHSMAEVSRLAVRAYYRRRKGETRSPVTISDEDYGSRDQPRFPYIPIGLYLGVIALAKQEGIETLFVLTEPRLADHFAKLGVKITQIGGPVQHRGTRVPSMMNVDSIIKGLRFFVKPIWRVVDEQIQAGYAAGAPPISRRP
ncbi:PEP-CTERM/exosortase system-associated acyltransferase [Zoogloea sp.]|uniref:PEP-CTERM/exosortase system-associated acyltransferase n=1 Tax=Zoogloea sp. TaxID=49181 RepID=UPI002631AD53|nr:PEP-CTERM/exosortase system-associated acyltransferase [Zoogloea sp.]MDD3352497.1 PEP-CTERM/exosortase system-associated acyltransferase [Zoogloea sp.]